MILCSLFIILRRGTFECAIYEFAEVFLTMTIYGKWICSGWFCCPVARSYILSFEGLVGLLLG